jgi:hypothetical protein
MSNVNFISIPFKIDGNQTGGFSVVSGIAKVSRAGIVLEFEARIFGLMKTGVKEVRVPLAEIEEIKLKKRFFKFTLEVWLNNFKTVNEIPNKDGRIILRIAKDDRLRAEQAVKVLHNARAEKNALEISQTPVGRLFGNEDETDDSGGR